MKKAALRQVMEQDAGQEGDKFSLTIAVPETSQQTNLEKSSDI